VLLSTSGTRLLQQDALDALQQKLFPLATLITPNLPESEVLAQMKIITQKDMLSAAQKIGQTYRCAVLCKGGHSTGNADDLLYWNGAFYRFTGARIDNPNTHGTGCTLSSAIAANLAKGFDLKTSVQRAKAYISGALHAMLDLGAGNGPLQHGFAIANEFTQMPHI
jgi:hydroxymethylpyrimidine/phosphomethylpyrimidine kinase